MKKLYFAFLFFIPVQADIHPEDDVVLLKMQEDEKKVVTVPFSFKNEPITNIVSMLTHAKRINILEPIGAIGDAYKKLTVTFSADEEIPVDDAWNLLQTFLKLGGYSLVLLDGEGYEIVARTDQSGQKLNFTKEVLPLYINQEPDDLPFTDAPIRALFYIENLQLPATTDSDPVSTILKDMLSVGSAPVFDPATKSIVLTDSANLIASAMKVIYALDRGGVRETVEIIPLFNTTASVVANFLKTGLGISGSSQTQPAYLGRTQRPIGHPYFSPNTSIVSDDRMNALIILGREAHVERLKNFIEEYIDVPPDKGESILHTYDLQYLDSIKVRDLLAELFTPLVAVAPTGASEAVVLQAGPERYFQNPIVIAETLAQVKDVRSIGAPLAAVTGITGFGGASTLMPYQGGNKLIIGALSHDWERIHDLLKKIDRPERNVIIEALIVDVRFEDDKFLRGAIRNPKSMGLQEGQSFQSQNLPVGNPPIGNALVYDTINGTSTPTGDLSVDLLKNLAQSSGNTLASFATAGTLFISFKDPSMGGIWGLIEIFKANEDFKILQHPSVVTSNNTTATISFAEIRRDFGTVSAGSGGALTIPIVDVTAQLAVSITPRTSSNERVNLTIAVEISDFTSGSSSTANQSDFDRRNRAIGTNVNMSNNQVVALGGLVSSTTATGETVTPILGRIPLIGNFFRGTTKTETKTNLVIFISARIVEPRGHMHTEQYTQEKLARTLYHFDDYDLFTTLQDPITHVFFKKDYDEKHIVNDFLLETNGTMLDPATYTHDICNDEKMASKIAYIDKRTPEGMAYEEEFARIKQEKFEQLKAEKFKEMLACEQNPLVMTACEPACQPVCEPVCNPVVRCK